MTRDRVDDHELQAQSAEALPDREAMTLLDPSGGAGGVFGGIEPGLGVVDVGTEDTGSTTTDGGGDLLGVGGETAGADAATAGDASDTAADFEQLQGMNADRDETIQSSDSDTSTT